MSLLNHLRLGFSLIDLSVAELLVNRWGIVILERYMPSLAWLPWERRLVF